MISITVANAKWNYCVYVVVVVVVDDNDFDLCYYHQTKHRFDYLAMDKSLVDLDRMDNMLVLHIKVD